MHRFPEAGAGGGGDADVGANRDPHAAESRSERADGSEEEADGHAGGKLAIVFAEIVGNINDDGEERGEAGDGAILPAHISLSATLDCIGNFAHLGGAGILGKDETGEICRHEHSKCADP